MDLEKNKVKLKIKDMINFKKSKDVDTFYRFVNDNSLRREAKMVLEFVLKKTKSLAAKKQH